VNDDLEHSAPETGRTQAAGQAAEAGGTPGPAKRPARILILEDEAWDAELAQRLLAAADLQITAVVVDNRESFTEQLTAFQPDVILSDFALPGFSGRAALAIVQETCPHIPFIVWSGVLADEAAVDFINLGATDYILKDRPARLATVVQRALAEAKQRGQLGRLEDHLLRAQRLAALGQPAAGEPPHDGTAQAEDPADRMQ
jgi:DNA-binding NtrC family response regulator